MRDELVTAPASEPITLAEAKAFLGIGHNADDALVSDLIQSAREVLEVRSHRCFITQTRDYFLDRFPFGGGYFNRDVRALGPGFPGWLPSAGGGEITLPRSPVASITSITYLDASGVLQTLSPSLYRVIPGSPGRVVPAVNQSFPATLAGPDVVTVRYVAGSSAASASARQAIRLLVTFGYENRDPSSLTYGYTGPGIDAVWVTVDRILAAESMPR